MENIDVVIGSFCYAYKKGWAFNIVVNGTTHVLRFRSKGIAEFNRKAELLLYKNNIISDNVKKFYEQNDQLYTMAASHEFGLIANE